MWRRLVVLGWTFSLAACATSMSQMQSGGSTRDVLLAPEIVASRVVDAYQAVMRLRPEFLRWRGSDSGVPGQGPVRVFLDDVEIGGPDALRQVSLDAVTQIRFISASEAAIRFGTDRAGGGVILVSTQKTASLP